MRCISTVSTILSPLHTWLLKVIFFWGKIQFCDVQIATIRTAINWVNQVEYRKRVPEMFRVIPSSTASYYRRSTSRSHKRAASLLRIENKSHSEKRLKFLKGGWISLDVVTIDVGRCQSMLIRANIPQPENPRVVFLSLRWKDTQLNRRAPFVIGSDMRTQVIMNPELWIVWREQAGYNRYTSRQSLKREYCEG